MCRLLRRWNRIQELLNRTQIAYFGYFRCNKYNLARTRISLRSIWHNWEAPAHN
jgi:hypothetical protein